MSTKHKLPPAVLERCRAVANDQNVHQDLRNVANKMIKKHDAAPTPLRLPWYCAKCTLCNRPSANACSACGATRTAAPPRTAATAAAAPPAPPAPPALSADAAVADGWHCPRCTFHNDSCTTLCCGACCAERPSVLPGASSELLQDGGAPRLRAAPAVIEIDDDDDFM